MFEPFKHQSLRKMTCLRSYPSLVAGISTRKGGRSPSPFESLNMGLHVHDDETTVIENRKLLAQEIGIPIHQWVIGEQVHNVNVKLVNKEDCGKGVYTLESAVPGVDGLITNQKHVLLAAFYADCVPLYFLDDSTGWIGIAHAGWKGTVKGMAKIMINRLIQQGASMEHLQMTIGPCISKTHYEVDKKVIDQIPVSYHKETITKTGNNHFLLDLKQLNHKIAQEAGLKNSNIHITEYCTYEEERLLYSHRRDQGKTGRMLGYIGWKG